MMLTWLLHTLRMQWYLFGYKSVLEILLISTALYYWLRLLAQDRQKPLAQWFSIYLVTASLLFYLQLLVINQLLIATAPAVLLFFMLIHHETLQKNFISLRNITPVQPAAHDWLAELVRLCMISINDKKKLLLVIEKMDSLATTLECPLRLNAPITTALLNLLYGSVLTTDNFWWLDRHGIVRGINARIKNSHDDLLADILLLSSKTDALFIMVDTNAHRFTLIAHTKLLETDQATQLLIIMRHYLAIPALKEKKEQWYDTVTHHHQHKEQQA